MTDRREGPEHRLSALSLRDRASTLYSGRRRTLLERPVQAMRRARLAPVVDGQHRHARAEVGDIAIEAGFSNVFRVFGALIDTLWTGRRGQLRRGEIFLQYRFGRGDRGRFLVKRGSEGGRLLAARLEADREVRRLIAQAELKSLSVEDGPAGRRVQIQPMAGTITAVYFPPLPPYTVALHPEEADAQLKLLMRLLSL